MLKDIVSSDTFINLFNIKTTKKYRMANEELVLRVHAFSENYKKYKRPLTKFLNDTMHTNSKLPHQAITEFKSRLEKTMEIVYRKGLSNSGFPSLSKATTEAILVGALLNLETLQSQNQEQVAAKLQALRSDPEFNVDALKEGLAAPDKVKARLSRAIEIFSRNA